MVVVEISFLMRVEEEVGALLEVHFLMFSVWPWEGVEDCVFLEDVENFVKIFFKWEVGEVVWVEEVFVQL